MLCLKVKRLKRLLLNHINKLVDIVESGKVIGIIVNGSSDNDENDSIQ